MCICFILTFNHFLPTILTFSCFSCCNCSLMESFVPFGGFFSTPSDLNAPLNRSCQYLPRCHLCNEKCEQEILSVSKGGFIGSVADQHQSSLPSWMEMAEIGTNKGLDAKVCIVFNFQIEYALLF